MALFWIWSAAYLRHTVCTLTTPVSILWVWNFWERRIYWLYCYCCVFRADYQILTAIIDRKRAKKIKNQQQLKMIDSDSQWDDILKATRQSNKLKITLNINISVTRFVDQVKVIIEIICRLIFCFEWLFAHRIWYIKKCR